MSEYPEDVMKAARRVLDEALYGGDGLNVIAAAIMAERERCASAAYNVCAETLDTHLGKLVHIKVMKGGAA